MEAGDIKMNRLSTTLPRHKITMARPKIVMERHEVVMPRHKFIQKADKYPAVEYRRRPKLALLIAAHNEEVVLANTLRSAISAGMKPEHIYLVDDASSDKTSKIAREFLPKDNIVKVRQSGKGLALTKATKKFNLTKRYKWIHIADADGAFGPRYFTIFRRELSNKYSAATGYVKSLPGKRISEFRVMEYTMAMEIHRRLQAMLHIVPVIPGPSSCFRADIFEIVNFASGALTEDFDVTLQLHRRKLGKVQFIKQATVYTQDPQTLKDYKKQMMRWNRGGLQTMLHQKVGRKFSKIDAYLSYQVIQNLLFFASYLILVPYLAISRHNPAIVASAFLVDVLIAFVINLLVSIRSKRWDIMTGFPHIYILRWIGLLLFMRAFVEVVIFRKYRNLSNVWGGEGPTRYKVEVAT
ncbi:MAG: glycosyltransferase [Candidatus Saccharimonadales bacterium]